MAIGDAAAAAGYDVVPGTDDIRKAFEETNKTRDYLADHKVNGVHPWSKISGKPSTFTPAAHTHTIANVTGLQDALNNKAGGGHVHDDRYYLKSQVDGAVAARALAFEGDGNKTRYTRGPDPEAFARQAGANRFATWMDDSLQFGRSSSSLRYKDNVSPWAVDTDALLSIEPQTFHRKVDEADVMDFGAIAEHLDDAGLTDLVYYDDQGRPDGIQDHRVVWALLAVVRDLNARIKTLEGR